MLQLAWCFHAPEDLDFIEIAVVMESVGLDVSNVQVIEVNQLPLPIGLVMQFAIDVQLDPLPRIGQCDIVPLAVVNGLL